MMGFQLEHNWYIVVKNQLPRPNIDETRDYIKEGYRQFPVSDKETLYELPIILDGNCIGMGIVTMQIQVNQETHIKYKMTKRFKNDDPTALHYTAMYKRAKEKEEI